ncbi:Hypothetical_protein [Hexamita inflata]|uniref:Hypothetical_protein n=1 Tax=Hexamita inflata TaxID=28002 RepID=A0AA86U865_9EUKA|nr:Hypothetical protein HINF_LOCUS32639 [Hexamita inflata]
MMFKQSQIIIARPINHHTLCSPFIKFVTYHVNLLTVFEIVLVGTVQSYICGFIVIGANTINISIYRIQNTKSYQFHSKVEQLGSISKTSLLSIFIESSYVASYVNQFSLIQIYHLNINRIVQKTFAEQFGSKAQNKYFFTPRQYINECQPF